MNKNIYIAGKITGLENFKERFEAAEIDLRERGFIPMNPAKLNSGFEHGEYMHICYAMIDICDSIYMLLDWQESKGAVMEHEYARKNHKDIIREVEINAEVQMINLKELYKMQNYLDKYIVEKSMETDINHNSKIRFLSDRVLALFTEVGEFANATRCFKYWSKKPSESKERLLDEYVDMLHFWLSIGNIMKFTPEEVQEAYLKKNKENMERQVNGY